MNAHPPADGDASGTTEPADPDGKRSFESLLDEAEDLATRLESRTLPLEEALDAYAAGIRKLKACEIRLRGVEERAKILVADGQAWRLAALDNDENDDGQDEDGIEDED